MIQIDPVTDEMHDPPLSPQSAAKRKRRLALGAVGLAIVCAAAAALATPLTTDVAFTAAGRNTTAATTCASSYHRAAFSIDLVMQNNTGQVMTLDESLTDRSDGHWAARPPATLEPGACAVINAYSDDITGHLWMTATYRIPDGTYFPFGAAVDGPTLNRYAFNKLSVIDPTIMPYTDVNTSWRINETANSGTVHLHWTLVAQPA